MAIEEMHDDEVRARLGLAPLGRPMTMEERIEANALRAFPEPFDPGTEGDLELLDIREEGQP
ncbi:hypothetical protein I5G61_gp68 [Mycobacterium phage Quesadilla]|uniref:Uncharacterized protein n=1 Tax=Mycobacterium phage Quesadilla TaxID=2664226 RepID=A0A5Q2W9Y6_9CAUD|nr:hypothetical protein I5G61_gp68 [Mycobacterium phage Quesadilla]QGH75316.1 hypothetical protein SEA_QUESADILLA_68 [Mycobacterium phage Quesadilla]